MCTVQKPKHTLDLREVSTVFICGVYVALVLRSEKSSKCNQMLRGYKRKPGHMLALPSLLVFNITSHVFMSVETGYGQDLSAFGHSFADPSQQTASYAAVPSAPSSGAQPAVSNFGRGQNHNVQGFHPYRRWAALPPPAPMQYTSSGIQTFWARELDTGANKRGFIVCKLWTGALLR